MLHSPFHQAMIEDQRDTLAQGPARAGVRERVERRGDGEARRLVDQVRGVDAVDLDGEIAPGTGTADERGDLGYRRDLADDVERGVAGESRVRGGGDRGGDGVGEVDPAGRGAPAAEDGQCLAARGLPAELVRGGHEA